MNEDVKLFLTSAQRLIEQLQAAVNSVKWLFEAGTLPASTTLPHPGPLPLGEGESQDRASAVAASTANGEASRERRPTKTKGKLPKAPKCERADLETQLIARLKQPFGSKEIQGALGCHWKRASNLTSRWAAKGWLRKVAFGAYERTEQFPGGKVPPPKASVTAPADGLGPIEREVYYAAKHAPPLFTAASLAVATGRTRDTVMLGLQKLQDKGLLKLEGTEEGELTFKVLK